MLLVLRYRAIGLPYLKTTVSGIGSENGTSADDAATDEKKSVTIDSQSCVGLGRRQARGMAALSAAAQWRKVVAGDRKFAAPRGAS